MVALEHRAHQIVPPSFLEWPFSFVWFGFLTHAGHEQVHGRDRFAVLVVPHVEGLDVAGVVVDEHSRVVSRLGQPPLVLRLKRRGGVQGGKLTEPKMDKVLEENTKKLGSGPRRPSARPDLTRGKRRHLSAMQEAQHVKGVSPLVHL